MRSGVRTPSGPLIPQKLRPGMKPGLFRVTTFVHPAALIDGRLALLRLLPGLHLGNLDFVVTLQTRERILKSLRRRMHVLLRHNNTGMPGDTLNAERFRVGLSQPRQEGVPKIIQSEWNDQSLGLVPILTC